MARERVLKVVVLSDWRKFHADRKQAETGLAKFTSHTERLSKRLSGLGGVLTGGAVVLGLKKTIDAASAMNETMSKTRVVFGPAAASVEKFASTAATSLGLSKQEALESTATLGNLFVSMKLGQRPAAEMSTKMVQLAADMASFNNASPTDTLEAIRAGLVGETEPLRKYGVNLNDAALRQEALRLGLVKTTKDTLPASIRAQAAYSLILTQSKTAQGDFARTSGGLANQQRILNAEWKDAQANLGKVLLPAMLSGVKTANRLLAAFSRLDAATGGLASKLGLGAAGLAGLGFVAAKVVGQLLTVRKAWLAYRAEKLAQVAVDATVGAAETGLAATTTATGTAAAGASAGFGALAGKLLLYGGAVAAAAEVAAKLSTEQGRQTAIIDRHGSILDRIKRSTTVFGFAQDKAKDSTQQQSAALDAQGKALQSGAAQTRSYTGALAGGNAVSAAAAEKANKLTAALKEQRAGFKTAVAGMRDAILGYDGLISKSKVTAKQVVADLRNQVANFRTYARDTQRLIKAGVDPKFIQELAAKGPQYVHALATGSNAQLKLAKQYFAQRQTEIRTSFAASMQRQYEDLVRKMRAMQREINKLKGKDVTVTATAKATIAAQTVAWLRAAHVKIPQLAAGGKVTKGTSPTADDVLAMLSRGETVVSARDSRDPGFQAWAAQRGIPGFASGGRVGNLQRVVDADALALKRGSQHAMDRLAGALGGALGKMIDAAVAGMATGGVSLGSLSGIRGSNQAIVRQIFASMFGWGSSAQWAATNALVSHESGWRNTAQNPTSTAYGLFQFLDSTWAGTGIRKTSDPRLQAVAGGRYIRGRYNSPIGAWGFWQGHHWYDSGGWLPPGLSMAYNGTGRPERVLPPGSGGMTVNVTVNGVAAADTRSFAAQVAPEIRRALREALRREGRNPAPL